MPRHIKYDGWSQLWSWVEFMSIAFEYIAVRFAYNIFPFYEEETYAHFG